ncbi:hypothetical protein [Streptomyces antnestii]|uniref:hypothetical protein n=1 Tax=Streptomyces antnestii TaxID=2494256 RepID=UPI0016754FCF|nr:hypothetical protein [Streptomyces sp. San01]
MRQSQRSPASTAWASVMPTAAMAGPAEERGVAELVARPVPQHLESVSLAKSPENPHS